MRETWTTLKALANNNTQTQSTDTAASTFLASEINRGYRLILSELRNFKTQITYTATTTSGQQYYHMPAAQVMLETVVITVGSVRYSLRALDSPQKWEDFNAVQFTGIYPPQFFFPRKDDFGLFPKPQGAYTMDITFSPRYADLSNDDYTAGTISVTNGSINVTGSGTAWTTAMATRWINISGIWYRIATAPTTTGITLENDYEGTTASGLTYTIGQSPELPEELGILLAQYAAASYFSGFRGDVAKSTWWNNVFWTGDGSNSSRDLTTIRSGLLGAINRYSSRSDSGIVQRNIKKFDDYSSIIWGTSIS